MLNALGIPVIQWKKLSPLFFLSAGAILGLSIALFALGQRAEQKNASLMHEFGTAVAQLSARDLVDTTLSQNLIGMHAIMQQVVAQPRVQLAAVYDLDQNLLVQAGQRQGTALAAQAFSAPIPLHDSIAGHVTVTLDTGFPGDQSVRWTLTGTFVLLLILMALAFYEGYGPAWQLRPAAELWPQRFALRPQEEAIEPSGPLESEPEPDWDSESASVAALAHSDLVLAVPNRGRLQQQLSSERFAALVSDFEHSLDQVLALYGGVRVGQEADAAGVYCIRFTSSESASEAAFRAACCAHLVQTLNSREKVRLKVLAQICHPDFDVKMAMSDSGIYLQAALVDPLLQTRLVLDPVDEQRANLTGFKPPFASLLERQLEQLSA